MNRPPHGELLLVEDVPRAFADLVAGAAAGAATGAAADAATSAAGDGRRFRIALSGGETARLCYEQLAAADALAWPRVECFLGDERCVPPSDPAANQRLVRETLVDRVAELAVFHPMNCERPDEYEALLRESGPLDLVHLGLGPDGHTASLFPGSAGLEAPPGRLVVHNSDPSGQNPYERLSFTFEAIARSRLVVFTVSGEKKRQALARVLAGDDLPAARVTAERVLWLCDAAALPEGAAGSEGPD